MNFKNIFSSFFIRKWNINDSVYSYRTEQRLVNNIRTTFGPQGSQKKNIINNLPFYLPFFYLPFVLCCVFLDSSFPAVF